MNNTEILELITSVVCQHSGLTFEQLRHSNRRKELVKYRSFVFTIARIHHDIPLTVIGRFYDKDHSTVMHNVNTFLSELTLYKGNKHEFEEVSRKYWELYRSRLEAA